ncbi:U3 small nucleolar rna-associated protein 6-like protein [Thalictrum thalictroides]|uniref:U3 small nucleolar rna-associated protein 6-like protein n=1 Tax=Thalictrum thalictroides TaxID=46969 RepID=A0A7J6WCJ8_THATH|nr:U3 small nucleolar rna-associated protein 6-like protein [Thalictrum thalictroides]
MADVVRFRTERMLDELDDFEKKGIFTPLEIKEIARKRTNFEYKLKRPSPLKEDFLAYIEYEMQLDSLRRLRKKSVSRQLQEIGKKRLKKTVYDEAIVRRIIKIYHLATTRFKGDINLWMKYIEFCKQHGHGRLKTVLAKVIRFHPKKPSLYMYAAQWEFDHNLNAAAARALMMEGLRQCPSSEDLWVEYLRMELTYLYKLKTRKVVLGEDTGSLTRDPEDNDEKQWKDDNKDLFMPLDEERANDGSDVQDEDSENQLDVFGEQASKTLQAVYSNAVEALPSSMNLRKRFLEILDGLNLAQSCNLREEIIDGMKKDFGKDPEYWNWLARCQTFDTRKTEKMTKEELRLQLDKAVEIYEEALKSLPCANMFCLYTKFWINVISPEEDSQMSECTHTFEHSSELIPHLVKVYETAESMGCMTEDLACQYISLYLRLGRLDEARTIAKKLCKGKVTGAVKLWELRISIEMKWVTSNSLSLSKDDLHSTFNLVRDILSQVSISEAGNLWHMAIKFFSNHGECFDKLVQVFMALLTRYTEGGFSISSAFVNFILQRDGIRRAREMYKRILTLPNASLALHQNCIELESNLAFVGDKDGLVNARKLYESALTTYSQDVGLWHDYFSLEKKVGTSETANGVYWRARKTVNKVSRVLAVSLFSSSSKVIKD